jgi:hypothetical protein
MAPSLRRPPGGRRRAFGLFASGRHLSVGEAFELEGRVWLHARPLRPRPLDVKRLEHRVEIVTAALADDGWLL